MPAVPESAGGTPHHPAQRGGTVLSIARLPESHSDRPTYTEIFRSAEMSVGVYSLPAGAFDPQSPHTEDELYHIREGYGVLRVGETDHPVSPGTMIYVPSSVPHRFHSIRQSIVALVIFAPPEGNHGSTG